MKKTLLTVGLGILLLISLGLITRLAMTNHELKQARGKLQKEVMEANLAVGKARTRYGDASKYIRELEGSLKVEVEKWKGEVTRYIELEAKFNKLKKFKSKNPEVVYVEGPAIEVPAELNFTRGMLYQAVSRTHIVPIETIKRAEKDNLVSVFCRVKPEPNRDRKIPMGVGYRLHFNVKGKIVELVTDSGAPIHLGKLWLVGDDGKAAGDLGMQMFEVIVVDSRRDKFFWWNPRIDLGATLTTAGGGGSLGMSFMGYGKQEQMQWRFARVGLDLGKLPAISIDPVLWNLGTMLPIVKNIWLSPHLVYTLDQKPAFGLMIGATL